VKNTLPVPITEINAGTSRFWMHRPQGVVADAVSLIWASEGVAAFREERIIPDGAGVLLFNFGDAVRSEAAGSGETTLFNRVMLSGVFTHAASMFYQPGMQHEQLGIIFYPYAIGQLLGCTAEAVSNIAITQTDLPAHLHLLWEQLAACTHPAQRILLVLQWLQNQLHSAPLSQPLVQFIRRYRHETAAEITARTGYSQQHLNRLLRRDTGVNLKTLQRIFRLNDAVQVLSLPSQHSDNLTALAVDAGYFDQAHFNHEFKAMTGFTPAAFRKMGGVVAGRVIYLH
jgi:AraC-like DNA-binding protein